MDIPATLPPVITPSDHVINLRPSRQLDGVLRPVDIPQFQFNYTGTPLAAFHTSAPDSRLSLLALADGWLTICSSAAPSQQLIELSDAADFLSVTPLQRHAVIMLRGRRPIFISLSDDNRWQLESSLPLPSVRFSVSSSLPVTSSTPFRKLSGSYTSWTGPLDPADSRLLAADLIDAYTAMADSARINARYIQPVMAWWRLSDIYGRIIHRSVPVIISPDGVQCAGPIASSVAPGGSSWSQLNGFKLSARAFTPSVTVDPCSWPQCKIDILITPPLDLILSAASVPSTFSFGTASSSSANLIASLPAADATTIVASMLDRLDSISVVAASLSACSDEQLSIDLRPERRLSVLDEQRHLSTALSHPVATLDPLIARCRLPHSFYAAVSHTSADSILWGNITPVPAAPPTPSDIAVSWSDSPVDWSEVSLMVHSDAGTLSHSRSGYSHAPVLISPLICYPLSGEVSHTMQLSTLALSGRRIISFRLSSSPDGRFAFYLDPSLRPVDPSHWVNSPQPLQPVAHPVNRTFPSATLLTLPSDPLSPLSVSSLAQGVVTAITPASRSSSAWDFGRRHYYIFSSHAIHAFTVARNNWSTSLSVIIPVGVKSPDAVAHTPYGAFAIGTDNIIRRINGSSATPFHSPPAHSDLIPASIAWAGASSELWLYSRPATAGASSSHPPITVFVDATPLAYQRTDIHHTRLLAVGDSLYIASVDGKLSLVRPGTIAPLTTVTYSRRIRLPTHTHISSVLWRLTSSLPVVTLSLAGDNGFHHRAQTLITLATQAPVNAPISAQTPFTPPYHNITATITGSVTPDTLIATTTLTP